MGQQNGADHSIEDVMVKLDELDRKVETLNDNVIFCIDGLRRVLVLLEARKDVESVQRKIDSLIPPEERDTNPDLRNPSERP